jgi:hypothetical protein
MAATGGEEEPGRQICEGGDGAERPAVDLAMATVPTADPAMAAVEGIVEEKGMARRGLSAGGGEEKGDATSVLVEKKSAWAAAFARWRRRGASRARPLSGRRDLAGAARPRRGLCELAGAAPLLRPGRMRCREDEVEASISRREQGLCDIGPV